MTLDADTAICTFAGLCLGWAIRSSIGITRISNDIAALPAKITEIARHEATHAKNNILGITDDHGERIHTLELLVQDHDRKLAALIGKGLRDG